MSFWSWWSKRKTARESDEAEGVPEGAVPARAEPRVYECRLCGKVFESRRPGAVCPECDSPDVERLG